MDEHKQDNGRSLSSRSQGGQDPLPPGRHTFDMSDLPTSWAESGLESNPLCFKARALFERPRFQESCRPAYPSFFSQRMGIGRNQTEQPAPGKQGCPGDDTGGSQREKQDGHVSERIWHVTWRLSDQM